MKKTIITVLVALFAAVSVSAQQPGQGSSKDVRNGGWFVTLGGGANISFDGYATKAGATGVAPAVTAGIGKWFGKSRAVGVKASYDGLSLKNSRYFPDGLKYNAVTGTILWDVSSTFGGYEPGRVVSFVPYAFAGMAFSNQNCFTAGAGLSLPVALGKVVSVVPDVKASYLDDVIYYTRSGGYNLVLEATLGLRFNF